MGNKVRIEIQIRKELQHESCYYLPLRNGVAFPFFLAPAFRNQVLSCNWDYINQLVTRIDKEMKSFYISINIYRETRINCIWLGCRKNLLVILWLHEVEFFFDSVNRLQNVNLEPRRNGAPTNAAAWRTRWLQEKKRMKRLSSNIFCLYSNLKCNID